jgi:type 1 fimbria pilin
MKSTVMQAFLWLTAALCVAALNPLARAGDEKTFSGEIADSQCAFNVHSLTQSHHEMLEMKHAGYTATDCVRYCVKRMGGKYVLQTKNAIYKLDDQALAEKSAGRKVKLTGTFDPKTNTIQIQSIEVIPPANHN